jgi:hypothetical protein
VNGGEGGGPVVPPDVGQLLAESDLHEIELRLRHAAYREGFTDGGRDQWAKGYAAAVADVKRSQHELVNAVRLGVRRLIPVGDAWLDNVLRHGGTEYGGKDRPRVAVNPALIKAAGGLQRGRAA